MAVRSNEKESINNDLDEKVEFQTPQCYYCYKVCETGTDLVSTNSPPNSRRLEGNMYLGEILPSMYNHESAPRVVLTMISSQIINIYPVTWPVRCQILRVCAAALAVVRNVKPSWNPQVIDVILMSASDDSVKTKPSCMNNDRMVITTWAATPLQIC